MAGNLRVDTLKFKDDDGNNIILTGEDFIGRVIQTQSVRSNTSFGTIGHSNPFPLTELDLPFTTKADNSEFIITSRFATTDSSSTNYGVGVGAQFSTDGGINWEYIVFAANHEDYQSGAYDTYLVGRLYRMTQGEVQVPKGTNLIFRVIVRSNSSNSAFFAGNGAPYYSMEHIVQEVRT